MAECVQPVGAGCAELDFQASAIGSCEIDVTFASGPGEFTETLSFVQTPCCPGFYVEPATASPVQVPDADLDAGATE